MYAYTYLYINIGDSPEKATRSTAIDTTAGIITTNKEQNPYFYAWDSDTSSWNKPEIKKQNIDAGIICICYKII
jgi:hypothetical protein